MIKSCPKNLAKKSAIVLPLIVILISFLMACSRNPEKITIITSPDEPHYKIARKISDILGKDLDLNVQVIPGKGSLANLDSLVKGKADFTICENNLPNRDSISGLFPLYPELLHILYKNHYHPKNFRSLVIGKILYMGQKESATHDFMEKLFAEFQISEDSLKITYNPYDSIDVYASFGDIIHPDALKNIHGFSLFSFFPTASLGTGNPAEAVSLRYPQIKPFIIPSNTYGPMDPEPVLTFSVDAILVCRSDLSQDLIYDITRTILTNNQAFSSISPLLFGGISETFEKNSLNFPLHNGSRMYLERDKPGFLERYAELMGLLFSLGVGFVSFLYSIAQWNKQRRKNRIDIFYKKALEIKAQLKNTDDNEERENLCSELSNLRSSAYHLLMQEKLEANESFRIFIDLCDKISAEQEKSIPF